MNLESYEAYELFGLDYRLWQTIEYRERTKEKYGHDTRNASAIELLTVLSGQNPSTLAITSLNDAIVEYDAACAGVEFDADPPPFELRVSASLSSIGFSWLPQNIDEVLSVLATDARLALKEVRAV